MSDLLSMFLGIVIVYSGLFGTGYLLYGNTTYSLILFFLLFISAYKLNKIMNSN